MSQTINETPEYLSSISPWCRSLSKEERQNHRDELTIMFNLIKEKKYSVNVAMVILNKTMWHNESNEKKCAVMDWSYLCFDQMQKAMEIISRFIRFPEEIIAKNLFKQIMDYENDYSTEYLQYRAAGGRW